MMLTDHNPNINRPCCCGLPPPCCYTNYTIDLSTHLVNVSLNDDISLIHIDGNIVSILCLREYLNSYCVKKMLQ